MIRASLSGTRQACRHGGPQRSGGDISTGAPTRAQRDGIKRNPYLRVTVVELVLALVLIVTALLALAKKVLG